MRTSIQELLRRLGPCPFCATLVLRNGTSRSSRKMYALGDKPSALLSVHDCRKAPRPGGYVPALSARRLSLDDLRLCYYELLTQEQTRSQDTPSQAVHDELVLLAVKKRLISERVALWGGFGERPVGASASVQGVAQPHRDRSHRGDRW